MLEHFFGKFGKKEIGESSKISPLFLSLFVAMYKLLLCQVLDTGFLLFVIIGLLKSSLIGKLCLCSCFLGEGFFTLPLSCAFFFCLIHLCFLSIFLSYTRKKY